MTTTRSRTALRLTVASGVDLAAAIDAFLSQPDLASTTRAKYRQTLTVLEDELGDAPVTGAGLAASSSSAGITRRRRRGTATSRPSVPSRATGGRLCNWAETADRVIRS